MSVYGFSENKCRVPVTKQQEFEQFKEKINTDFGTSQEENNDFLIKKMLLNMGKEIQPVVAGKYKNNTSITNGEYIETYFVEDFSDMFNGATKLTTVPEYDTTNAKTMRTMFYNCKALTSAPKLNTSSVTHMEGMFYNCFALTSVPELNTSSVTNMESMFYNCFALTSVPELNTGKVTNMLNMFRACGALTSIPDLDISKVTGVNDMFYGCSALTTFIDNKFAPVGSRWQFKDSVDFGSCPLDRASILKVFNGLQQVSGKTITISSTTNSYLSEEDKNIARNKGWTVTVSDDDDDINEDDLYS